MHLTEARTGVLIYVTPKDRRVEIVADVGIHSKVGEAAWEELAQEITAAARERDSSSTACSMPFARRAPCWRGTFRHPSAIPTSCRTVWSRSEARPGRATLARQRQ